MSLKNKLLSIFFKKSTIDIIGVGGGGSNIVQNISKANSRYLPIIINSDLQALNSKNIQNKIHLKKPDNYGCGGKQKCGIKLVTTSTTQELEKYIGISNRIFLVATLGGGVGGGSIQPIVKYLHSKNIEAILFLVMPFKFEGAKRYDNARATISKIKEYALNIHIVHNEHLIDGSDVSIRDSFSKVDKVINHAILRYKYEVDNKIIDLSLDR